MATTISKRKSVKKKTVKKKAVKKSTLKIDDKVNKLSDLDLRNIESYSKDVLLSKLEMNLQEQHLRNLSLEFKLMEIGIVREREKLAGYSEKFEKRKERYSEFMNSIGPKYGLKKGEGLGYNPDTGEIIK